ncbi:MAG: hypothetical protein ACXIUL_03910 [Wenzhouxiangella sp.]
MHCSNRQLTVIALLISVAASSPAQAQERTSVVTATHTKLNSVIRDEEDIIFQDRYQTEFVPVPGQVAERFITSSQLNAQPGHLVSFGDQAVFSAGGPIWFSDGSEEGTYTIDLPEGKTFNLNGHAIYDDRLYFLITNTSTDRDIWVTDGTEAGTQPVVIYADLDLSFSIQGIVPFGDQLAFWLFHDGDYRVFITDESESGGARQIEDLRVFTNSPTPVAALGGNLYVSGILGSDSGLFRINTQGEVSLVWELERQGPGNLWLPMELTVSGSSLYFRASQGEGMALWKYSPDLGADRMFDPTEAAQHMIGAVTLTAAEGRLYFLTRPWNPSTESFTGAWHLAVTTGLPETTDWHWPSLAEGGLNNVNIATASLGPRLLFRSEVSDGTASGTYTKTYDGTTSLLRPHRAVPGHEGIWFTATNDRDLAFAGFSDSDSFVITEPSDLRYRNTSYNLAMVDGLPWMIARRGFSGPWEIWRVAPEEGDAQ